MLKLKIDETIVMAALIKAPEKGNGSLLLPVPEEGKKIQNMFKEADEEFKKLV